MLLIFKPYNFLALTAMLLLVASFFISPFGLTFNITDTYYIIPNIQFFRIQALGLSIFAVFYKLLNKSLISRSLTWIHILIIVLFPIMISWISYTFEKSLALIEISAKSSANYFDGHQKMINSIFLIFIAIQILPIINYFFGAVKKNKKGF